MKFKLINLTAEINANEAKIDDIEKKLDCLLNATAQSAQAPGNLPDFYYELTGATKPLGNPHR